MEPCKFMTESREIVDFLVCQHIDTLQLCTFNSLQFDKQFNR